MNYVSSKIRRLARLTRWLSTAVIALGGIALVAFAFGALDVRGPHLTIEAELDPIWVAHPAAALIHAAVMSAIIGYGLLRLIRLMRLYEDGRVFESAAAGHIRAFAYSIFAEQLVDLLGLPVLTLVLRIGDPAQHIAFKFSTDQLWSLFLSGLFLLVSHVLAAAHLVADDNERIV